MSEAKPIKKGNQWFWRRLMGYAQTTFSMSMLTWLAWNGRDGDLHKLIAEGCLWLLFGNFLVYVAGATTDDLLMAIKGARGLPMDAKNDRPA